MNAPCSMGAECPDQGFAMCSWCDCCWVCCDCPDTEGDPDPEPFPELEGSDEDGNEL